MCWVVVTPISISIAKAYSQPVAIVSIIPMCYMVLYALVNFPSNWVLDDLGVKKGIIIGAVVTSLGAAIRCLVTTNFYFVIAGQILCGIAQPFILNAPTKIAVRWFLPESVRINLHRDHWLWPYYRYQTSSELPLASLCHLFLSKVMHLI